ncbi:MAG: hypothetical protein AB8H03_04180 [Saprospiraceae bacterium]
MEHQNNYDIIYQFTLVVTFGIALIFFVYLYWYSNALRKTVLEKEKSKQQLLENEIILIKIENEQQRQKEEVNFLEKEVLFKNKELTTSILLSSQHNEVLKKISNQLDDMLSSSSNKKSGIRAIKKMIHASINFEDNWDDFKLHFEKVHPDFFIKLGNAHPSLSQTDNKHCAYIRMKLNTKEIARLLGISATSVQMARFRLKKKMNLGKDIDLKTYIHNI